MHSVDGFGYRICVTALIYHTRITALIYRTNTVINLPLSNGGWNNQRELHPIVRNPFDIELVDHVQHLFSSADNPDLILPEKSGQEKVDRLIKRLWIVAVWTNTVVQTGQGKDNLTSSERMHQA
jgi:hypothetical protein